MFLEKSSVFKQFSHRKIPVRQAGRDQPDIYFGKVEFTLAFDLIDVVGEPIDTFCGYGNEDTVLYLAGLSFPKTFIDNLASSIKSEQDRVQKVMKDDDLCMDSNINFLATKPVEKKEPEKKLTMRERLLASANK